MKSEIKKSQPVCSYGSGITPSPLLITNFFCLIILFRSRLWLHQIILPYYASKMFWETLYAWWKMYWGLESFHLWLQLYQFYWTDLWPRYAKVFSSSFANATTIFKTLHSIYFNFKGIFLESSLICFQVEREFSEYSGGNNNLLKKK